ncbi:DUF397 domain-containing protein [Actinomadura sp. NPDC047616]|uniref:DUF397 domain-containing protein n=1 Tax=Actinomadura sp. NPDC047616 TaxID=3155914 RepID=UPI0033EBC83C
MSTTSADVRWRKSSHSDHHGGQCVEISSLAAVVAVRDSKNPDGPKLAFAADEWRAFTEAVKGSEYDLG